MATKNQAIELMVISLVADNGELTESEIVGLVQENDDEADETTIRRMIVKLDRDGKLTRANNESGYQVTANGRGSLDGLRSKMEARYIAPYTNYGTVECDWEFISPTLGCITDPGNVGISRFPRMGEVVEYVEKTTGTGAKKATVQERVVKTPGQVMLMGGYILTALRKSADKSEGTVTIDKAGMRRTLPDVAWSRVTVKTIILPSDQPVTKSVRRPTNTRDMAIGEIVHESLPPGTRIKIRATFPFSHFSHAYLVSLFSSLEDVGISAAGTGKGGMWGVGYVKSLTANGEQIWPHHAEYKTKPAAQSVGNLTSPAAPDRAPVAQSVLQSDQPPVTASDVSERPAASREDLSGTEAPMQRASSICRGCGHAAHDASQCKDASYTQTVKDGKPSEEIAPCFCRVSTGHRDLGSGDPMSRLKPGAAVSTINGRR